MCPIVMIVAYCSLMCVGQADSTAEKLAKLKPAFVKVGGYHTPEEIFNMIRTTLRSRRAIRHLEGSPRIYKVPSFPGPGIKAPRTLL